MKTLLRSAVVLLTAFAATTTSMASRPLGIDVAVYQGHPTWSSVKGAGYIFAWAKATEGTGLTDTDYTYNQSNAKAAGVYIGSYHFAHPESDSPSSEENYFWSVSSPYTKADGLTFMPMLDMEVFSGHVGATSYSDWVNQWCNDEVADALAAGVNVKPAIYFSACHGNEFTSAISGWYSDIADYNGESSQTGSAWSNCASEDPWGSSRWNFWQFTSTGSIPGISGNVDHDVYNGTSVTGFIATATGYPNYSFSANAQGWTSAHSLTTVSWTGTGWPGVIYADQTNSDSFFYSPATSFVGATNPSINVNVFTQGTNFVHDMQAFWKTDASNTWSASKSSPIVNYSALSNYTRINLDCNNVLWTADTINQLRQDMDQTNNANRFIVDHILAQTTPRYTFDANAQGWTSGHSLSAISWSGTGWPGIIYADQTNSDCYYYGPSAMGFWGANNDRVHVRVYPQSGTSGGVHDAQLYWITSSDGTWNTTKSFGPITYYGNDKYCDIYFNVGLNTLWNGNNNGGGNGGSISQLRLDFDNTNYATRWIVDSVQIEHVNYDLPTITTQPANLSVAAGSNAVFSVVGKGGNSALTYQWYKIGSNMTNGATVIAGATNASLTITNAQTVNATNYQVTVANLASAINSTVVSLTVTTNSNIPPTITAQPSDQSVTQGANAAFSVTVTGSAPLAYQWNFNGTNISGATASSYTVVSAQLTNEGFYAVVVTNAYGSATSSSANLNVNIPPSITTQPSSQTVTQGDSPTFTVIAAGDSPLTYQWSLNGTNITDATDSSYNVVSAQSSDVGSYTVVVANIAGSVTSTTATLTVNFPPLITTDLFDQSVTQGQNAVFSIISDGTAPLSYQWTFNGANISGATASSYTVVSAQPTDAGVYAVTVTNFVGSDTSSNANLTVNVPPAISTQPSSLAVNQGSPASFSVVAAGTAPLSYQWTFNGGNISGATDSSYTLANAQPANAGNYAVVVTNIAGTVTSANAALTVNTPPSITTQPSNLTVNQGQLASFSVVAAGTAPLNYQWTFNGGNISGATASSYTIASAQPTDAGNYAVVINNAIGSVTSANAALTVNIPPSITTQPSSQTVTQGQNAAFSVVAAGTAPLAYQWTFNGGNISGATASSYTVVNAQSGNAGSYAVVVTNVAGTVTSGTATLTVNIPPSITTQPANSTVNQGQNATFSVVAAGTAPLSYQWSKNGGAISGATASSYTVISAQSTDAGSYAVVVTNLVGSVTSANAILTVIIPPSITTQPASQLTSVSNSVTFSVTAAGTAPLAYQWSKNGTAISGATASSLAFASVKWTNAGSYTVVITNAAGSVTSSTATLTVQQAVFTFVDGFETYALGALDNNYTSGPNTNSSNPWWGIPTLPNVTVFTNLNGVTPHGGTKMIGGKTNGSLDQVYVNLPYRLNAGSNYFGNFVADWWFYDPKGAAAGASNYQDYIAIAENLPVSLTNDQVTTTFTSYNQRMSLGAYAASGYHSNVYQGRLVGSTGGLAGGWFNTTTPRTVGWHHGRMVVGIPVANSGPVWMFIDDMFTPVFTYANSGTNVGFNLIEVNSAFGNVGSGSVFDDLSFRSANDPWIAQQPTNKTVNAGQNATFVTMAVGTSYQWQLNGSSVSGATTTACTITNAQDANAGSYVCVITGANGTTNTTAVTLTVNDPPVITTQPSSQTVTQGAAGSFSVVAGGQAPLSYQWNKNGSAISGATTTSYSLASAQTTDAGSYTVVVTNALGSVTSVTATLTVNVPAGISSQPQSATVTQGSAASFSVTATGTAPLSYQWALNGANISGATASSYSIASAQVTDAGSYTVIVTNVAGSVTSSTATLTVNVPPSITTQPGNATVNQGQSASFSVVAAGTAPLTYQWRINTLSISGATNASITINNCQATDAGSYSCQVTNVAGSVISADGVLTVLLPPAITAQPASQLASVSNSVTFTVSVTGTAPLAYQWSKNGAAISGATTSSLALTALKWTNAGSYSVVVTNAIGSVTSSVVTLTVQQAAFSYVDGFETYTVGALDNNYTSGPNTNSSNPWWGIPTLPNIFVYTNIGGVTPHGGSKMMGGKTNGQLDQVYLNLPYRLNAGSNYYGNFMMDWWFYDTKGSASGASNYNDYIAIAQNLPVSLTNDFVTTTFTSFNQRMSLGAYFTSGYHSNVYQARLVAATGGINSQGWFNTITPRTVGWHHGRMIVGIPVANSGPVQMFIDNMTNTTFSYATSGTNVGFNLIEVNSAFGTAGSGGYFDDLTFQAANDPWIAQQPISTTVATGSNTSFSTVAIGTAYQWQLNGSNISGATTTTCTITNAQAGNAGTYNCVITGANGTTNTTAVTLTVQ